MIILIISYINNTYILYLHSVCETLSTSPPRPSTPLHSLPPLPSAYAPKHAVLAPPQVLEPPRCSRKAVHRGSSTICRAPQSTTSGGLPYRLARVKSQRNAVRRLPTLASEPWSAARGSDSDTPASPGARSLAKMIWSSASHKPSNQLWVAMNASMPSLPLQI